MQFDIITIFPNYVENLFSESILKRAQEEKRVTIKVHDLRKYTNDKRGTVDDHPFGGGPGMLLMVEPIYQALKDINVYPNRNKQTQVWLTSARGENWQQDTAIKTANTLERIVLICGRYEGVDQRVSDYLVDREVSIGNYVLTGGELAAGVIVDSVTRLLPDVLGNANSLVDESHNLPQQAGEYPQYTRPARFQTAEDEASWNVPDILLSGDHEKIKQWRLQNLN